MAGSRPVADSGGGINLAKRPFVNSRPVVRTSVLLWSAGLLLAIWAGVSFYGYFAGRVDQRTEIAEIEASMAQERAAIANLEVQLSGLALDNQNSRVAFLNERIAERTFSWSLLFDRLADILPNNVRLLNLTPQFTAPSQRSQRATRADSDEPSRSAEVLLSLQGAARSPEDLLAFVDALFADPAFERPNPHQENRDGGDSRFSLSVTYLPQVASSVDEDPAVSEEPPSETAATAETVDEPAILGGEA